jgi:hypothetical protein
MQEWGCRQYINAARKISRQKSLISVRLRDEIARNQVRLTGPAGQLACPMRLFALPVSIYLLLDQRFMFMVRLLNKESLCGA